MPFPLGLDFIIQLKRDRHGERMIDAIAEIGSMEGDTILSQKIVSHNEINGVHFTGLVPSKIKKLMEHGLDPNFMANLSLKNQSSP